MNYEQLEALYNSFIEHDVFKLIEKNLGQISKDHVCSDNKRNAENWEYNGYFWSNYISRAASGLSHTDHGYSFELSGKTINLKSIEAPDFKDKDKYLNWLIKELNS